MIWQKDTSCITTLWPHLYCIYTCKIIWFCLVPVWTNCLFVVFRSKDGRYAFSLSSISSIGADTTSVISQLLFLPNIMWIQLQLADERKEYLPSPAPLLLPILHSFCNISHGRRPDKLFMLNCVVWTVLQFLANSLIGETGRELGLVLLEYLLNACISFKRGKKETKKTALAHYTSYDRCKNISSYLKQKPKGMGKTTVY